MNRPAPKDLYSIRMQILRVEPIKKAETHATATAPVQADSFYQAEKTS